MTATNSDGRMPLVQYFVVKLSQIKQETGEMNAEEIEKYVVRGDCKRIMWCY